ncbi:MAG: RNA polymerase sigma factor [Deferribacteres bacterium]|nr:RNA polymerase sigma factor [candidate division KSB1 bacterium]MCB9500498.1 RNA polymerase sigma factor [Deferribacteres bacterium]
MPVATTDKKEKIPVQEDERLLIRRAQKDPEEFRHLFDLYHDAIFNYVLRRTFDVVRAQDITSNTFLKALDNLNKFHWKGVGFSAWLYRIATNEINLSYRNQNKTVPLSEDITKRTKDELTADHALIQAEENMLRNEKFREMHAALAQLDEKYQTVLSLKYFEEKSTKEIAEILGISENTVKTHTRRGLLKLRDIL